MNTLITILSAILVFGFLIFIHEFGHFITARIFKVTVNEFSVGMGPRLIWYDSKKSGTRYSLSMLPIGGYVAMAGEDGESDDPNSFDKKPAWQRFIITVAGASVNLIFGFLAMILFTALSPFGGTTVADFTPQETSGYEISSEQSGLMSGDTVLRVDGKRVRSADELSYEIMRRGIEPIDLLVLRDGEEVLLEDVVFPTLEESGVGFGAMDFRVYASEKTVGSVLTYSFGKSILMVRMVYESLFDLISGRYSFGAMSGPVGISSSIGTAAKAGPLSLLYITVLISINLGVMNLLPIPALDGGRMLTILIEMITRKRLPKKVETAINATGLMLLLGLSLVIMVKDVIFLII